MKAMRIASLGLVALFILTPGASALTPFPTIKASLVQKVQPVFHSYPGVSADILGIRTGMALAKAEAIAEKSYAGRYKPEVSHSSVSLMYSPPFGYGNGGVTVQSHSFISNIGFRRMTDGVMDQLQLYFSSPASGNTLLGARRQISYESARQVPFVSTVKALLIKKYGPPSYQSKAQNGGLTFSWGFKHKRPPPRKYFFSLPGVSTFLSPDVSIKNLQQHCSSAPSFPDVFRIDAEIDATNTARVRALTIIMWDPSACVNDAQEAKKQFMAAAIKYWEAKYKVTLPTH
jgi:hypothetical protein